ALAGPPNAGWLAFANPDGSLPGAEQEVKRIAPLFAQATILRGAEAVRARAQALPDGIATVHFATHGRVESSDLTASSLALADGRVKVGEIYGLPLRQKGVRTVALSACQTFVGQKSPGVEVLGLADAFAKAGAATVVSSLWNVSDASTAELMVGFYQSVQKTDKAEALRQAQLKLLRSKE